MALEKPSAIYAANILIEDRIDADAYNYLYIKEISKLKFSGLKLANITDFYSVEMLTGFENSKYINYTNQGIPFIRCKNIRDNYFDEDDLTYISEEVYNILKRAQLSDDDLLYTKTGSNLGQVCCVPKGMKAIASSNCCFFKKSQNKSIDSHYVSTFLNSKYGKVQTNRAQTKTGQPTIDFQRLKQFLIPIPSPEIQKYIGDKVRKAEELREEAKRLKKEAEEIFYEAIEIDKLNSKLIKVTKFSWIKENQIEDRLDLKYNSPSIITIYEHFRKYKCSLLKDEFKTISGYAFSSGDFDDMDGEKVIKIGDISDFTIDTTSLTRVKIGTKVKERIREFSCNIQDLVYAMTGATIGKVAMYIDNETVYINQRVACIKPKRNNIPTGYLLLYLNSDIGKEISYSLSTGVAQPNIALEELNNIVIPQLANNIMDKIHHNVLNSLIKHKESKQLIQEAKRDVEDLIEGNFDMSKVKANS
ncbi:type I restriction enzyme S subunit [Herbinix hemicellulosilytica]|uniref:Type I restriction modification DNA specificity domain-containing protein n=1 Tax=Herbinix hemicellulosilytica TaxID=1564487 RepID=A0A0H5SLX9_HERHM|nr:restriction endonuclease subunit S [Herbinix hemicellulosilytica]RBP58152.1 type I restriction enzyme S subunit [Herbinix hemicellulosilytica]CRZ35816.1 hypothetical protein HHT355_2635 [Herbinix hemicellulosilytica]